MKYKTVYEKPRPARKKQYSGTVTDVIRNDRGYFIRIKQTRKDPILLQLSEKQMQLLKLKILNAWWNKHKADKRTAALQKEIELAVANANKQILKFNILNPGSA